MLLLNSSLNDDSGKLCIRHRWEGEMGSSQHKSPRVLRSAHLAVPTMYIYILVRISISEMATSN